MAGTSQYARCGAALMPAAAAGDATALTSWAPRLSTGLRYLLASTPVWRIQPQTCPPAEPDSQEWPIFRLVQGRAWPGLSMGIKGLKPETTENRGERGAPGLGPPLPSTWSPGAFSLLPGAPAIQHHPPGAAQGKLPRAQTGSWMAGSGRRCGCHPSCGQCHRCQDPPRTGQLPSPLDPRESLRGCSRDSWTCGPFMPTLLDGPSPMRSQPSTSSQPC